LAASKAVEEIHQLLKLDDFAVARASAALPPFDRRLAKSEMPDVAAVVVCDG
jgi:hypothetical protein